MATVLHWLYTFDHWAWVTCLGFIYIGIKGLERIENAITGFHEDYLRLHGEREDDDG